VFELWINNIAPSDTKNQMEILCVASENDFDSRLIGTMMAMVRGGGWKGENNGDGDGWSNWLILKFRSFFSNKN